MPNSMYKLPILSDKEKEWLVDARATGMTYEEIAVHFQDFFPEYMEKAKDIPTKQFEIHFASRVKTLLGTSNSSAKLYLDAKKKGELPVNIEVTPLVAAHVRLQAYQRLWDETPSRELQRVVDTADGEERVYRSNTKDKLAILSEFRKELEFLGLVNPNKSRKPFDPDDSEIVKLIEGDDIEDLWDSGDDNGDSN